ncbi:MAG: tripartite tricarboxylate transporter substrate binding protein [Reyranellaceae bacterium]
MKRRVFAALAFGLGGIACAAGAQDYPAKPVTMIVPSTPGGSTDFAARLMADMLSAKLGKSIVVDNRGGASGNIGNKAAAQAAPDGYTLLMAYSGYQVANKSLFKDPGWDPLKSFTPVALVMTAPHVVLVRKDLPVNTLADLVAYGKNNPGKLSYASSGIGSIQHIGAEQLKRLGGFDMAHVPYRGAGPAMNDLLSGQIDLFITTPPSAVGHLQSKSVKGLAIAAAQRHPMLPEIPTSAESGLANFDLTAWFAVYAPAGTPAPIVRKLAAAIESVVDSPAYRDKVVSQGAYPVYMGPEQLDAFTRKELDHWSEVIAAAGIKAE